MPTILVILLVVWAGLLYGGLVFGRPATAPEGRMPKWTRLASSLTLLIAGWGWCAVAPGGVAASYARLIAIGITFGFAGDLVLGRVLRLSPRLLWGMLMFGLGHAAYITGILRFENAAGLTAAGPRYGAWLAWLFVGALVWYLLIFRSRKPALITWLALPYALLLASTAGCSAGLALQAPAFAPLAAGVVMFLVSDALIGVKEFAGASFPLANDAIWLTYGPGQMLIVYSVAAALRV